MSVSVVVPVVLCVLALLDGAFAGFRASLGRDARLRSVERNVTAAVRGMFAAVIGLIGVALTCGVGLVDGANRSTRFEALIGGGIRLLAVLAPVAVVTLTAIGVRVLAKDHELQAAAVTMVLGPITMLRQPIIVAGAVAAAWHDLHVTLPPGVVAAVWFCWIGPLVGVTYRTPARPRHIHRST